MERPNTAALAAEWQRLGATRARHPSRVPHASTPPPNRSAKKATRMANKTIKVDLIARVEGEGALDLRIKDGRVTSAKLKIFEPPRLFEALLRGRGFAEAPDITARICGICPVAYQMSSVHAMEDALGITVGGQLRALRRLLYCGEWIESHALHVVMLHAPDFLGYQDGIQMAREHGEAVRARPGAEENRQRADAAAGRARDPSGECPRRRVLPRAQPEGVRTGHRGTETGARSRGGDAAVGGGVPVS